MLDLLGDWWAAGPCVEGGSDACAESTVRVAAIDCGTNTIKLLIGDLHASGESSVAVREMRMVRLGQGVDATGGLADEALARTFAALDEYAALIAAHGVHRVRSLRDLGQPGRGEPGCSWRACAPGWGSSPRSSSGDEEARALLRRRGPQPAHDARRAGARRGHRRRVDGARAAATDAGVRTAAVSLDIGSVRLHERHLRSDPPTPDEVADCVAAIDAHLDRSPVPLGEVATVVGVGGTVTTVGAGVLDLPAYDRSLVDQAVLTADDVHAVRPTPGPRAVRSGSSCPGCTPAAADVIGAGVLILSRVLRRTRARTLVVSEADILDGIAWSST